MKHWYALILAALCVIVGACAQTPQSPDQRPVVGAMATSVRRDAFPVYSALTWEPAYPLDLPEGHLVCHMQYEHHDPMLPCWYQSGDGTFECRAGGLFHLVDRPSYFKRLDALFFELFIRNGAPRPGIICYDWESPGVDAESRESQIRHLRFLAGMATNTADDEAAYRDECAKFEAEAPQWYEDACASASRVTPLRGFFNVSYVSGSEELNRVRDASTAVFPAMYERTVEQTRTETAQWVADHPGKPVIVFLWPWNNGNPVNLSACIKACADGGAAGVILWDHVANAEQWQLYAVDIKDELNEVLGAGGVER